MAKCIECSHYGVCAREERLVQIDEHTWEQYNVLDDVEKYCKAYIPENLATIAHTLSELKIRLERAIGTFCIGETIKVVDMFKLIDQIAKEMLEGV